MKRLRMINYHDFSWKNNPNAVYVGRAKGEKGKWGNPFTIEDWGREGCLKKYYEWLIKKLLYEPDFLEPLRGKDLVCFCKLTQSCHGDIIIKKLESTQKTL